MRCDPFRNHRLEAQAWIYFECNCRHTLIKWQALTTFHVCVIISNSLRSVWIFVSRSLPKKGWISNETPNSNISINTHTRSESIHSTVRTVCVNLCWKSIYNRINYLKTEIKVNIIWMWTRTGMQEKFSVDEQHHRQTVDSKFLVEWKFLNFVFNQ